MVVYLLIGISQRFGHQPYSKVVFLLVAMYALPIVWTFLQQLPHESCIVVSLVDTVLRRTLGKTANWQFEDCDIILNYI